MKTKKNNACPLIKEIEEHDDVSSEKKKNKVHGINANVNIYTTGYK